jgi:tetratricopeptide (TPR) repeat protein
VRRALPVLVALLILGSGSGSAGAQDDVAPTPEDNSSHEAVQGSRGVRDIVDRIELDLDDWDVVAARTGLTELQQAMAGSSALEGLHLMEAKVLFYEGRYAEAVGLYETLGAGDRPGYAKLSHDALAETRDDLHAESAHFSLAYPRGKDGVLVPYALATLEQAYAALVVDFDYAPPGKIRVEILPDDAALARLSTLTLEQIRTTGTIAICKFNRLMVISPRALIHGYDWRDTLNHELVHLFVSMKSRNSVPIWLHEGLAKYEESRWRGAGGLANNEGAQFLLGRAVKSGKLITFEQMHPSMALLPSAEDAATAFAEVFHAIAFLKAKGGTAMWSAIIANLRAGQKYPEAVAHAYGKPFDAFVADWKDYLGSLHYPQEGSEVAEKPRFRSGPQKQDAVEQTELSDFGDVKNPEARKLAHLGGLLLARRHLRPAVEELGKAYVHGTESLQLASKYGEALLASDQPQLATRVLTAAEKLHPGASLLELYLGQALLKGGDPTGARDHFDAGMNTDPFDPRLHQGLKQAFTQLHDDAGVQRATEALRLLTTRPPDAAAQGPAHASLMLASHPFASVSVDGQPVGRTTPTVLELPPGKHHLALTNAERGLHQEADVELKPGETRELRVELDAPAASPAPADPSR